MNRGWRGEVWCRSRLKRGIDATVAALVLVGLAPLLLILGIAVLVTGGRPVLFRQERIGLGGRPFLILKYRTMVRGSERGLPVTGSGDARVTRLGRLLRATKLDELPQMVNVLRGDMSLVGPRPEVPRYVAGYDAAQRRVLRARPGLTDPATLRYRDEERLLGSVGTEDRERFYVEKVLPEKLVLNVEYVEQASPVYDLCLILRTLGALLQTSRR